MRSTFTISISPGTGHRVNCELVPAAVDGFRLACKALNELDTAPEARQ